MDFKTFQNESRKTALYPNIGLSIDYPLMGLMGEFGELCEKFKKVLRDNNGELSEDRKEGIVGELGDVCWYLFQIYSELKIDFNDNYKDYEINQQSIGSNTHLLTGMHCCIADISIFCLSNNQTLISQLTDRANNLMGLIKIICEKCNTTIENVMQQNVDKLQSRLKRNVIKGDGDNR